MWYRYQIAGATLLQNVQKAVKLFRNCKNLKMDTHNLVSKLREHFVILKILFHRPADMYTQKTLFANFFIQLRLINFVIM